VELDAVMKNRVHGPVKCHECTPDMLAVVKEDVHSRRGETGRIQRHRGWGNLGGCAESGHWSRTEDAGVGEGGRNPGGWGNVCL
jgi:hypothetical protein